MKKRTLFISMAVGFPAFILTGAVIEVSPLKLINQRAQLDGLKTAQRITPSFTVPFQDRFSDEVINLTNAERAAVGLAPLSVIPELNLAASFHVEDQKNKVCSTATLTHLGSDGSLGIDRILRTGLDVSRWAENIACGSLTPEAVVQNWMNSPTHRADILDSQLTHIGVAVGSSDISGLLYWVQDFATL